MQKTHKVRSWQRKFLRGIAIYVVVPYLSVAVIFSLAQRRLMYRPSVAGRLSVSELKLDAPNCNEQLSMVSVPVSCSRSLAVD